MSKPRILNEPCQTINLKEYVDKEVVHLKELIEVNKRLADSKFESAQIAINKAEEAQGLRNIAQNEWRQQSKDQTSTYATRENVEKMSVDIKDLQLNQANLAGKASQSSFILTLALSLVGVVIAIINFISRFS